MIAQQQAALYEAVWTGVPQYAAHSPGLEQLDRFLEMTGATGGTLLDAGCGSGQAALALQGRGFQVTLTDLTPAGLVSEARDLPFVETALWRDLGPVAYAATGTEAFDWVYCADVLEHVPPEWTMLVVARLLAITRHGLFCAISTVPDAFGVWAGQPLHATVRDFVWWRDRIGELGEIVEARDVLTGALLAVRRR